MFIYFLLLIYLMSSLVLVSFYKNKNFKIVSFSREKKTLLIDELLFDGALLMIWCLLCFKSIEVGTDTQNYQYMYSAAKEYVEAGLVWKWTNQPLYYLIFAFLEVTGMSFQTAMLCIYTVACMVIYFCIKKYSENKLLTVYLFVVCGGVAFYMSGVRQMMAMTLGFLAINYLQEKKLLRSLLLIIGSILIHKSAAILLLLLVLHFFIPTKNQLIIALPLMWGCAILLPKGFIQKLADLSGFISYEDVIGTSSNPLLILMYFCVGIYVLYIIYNSEWDSPRLRFLTVIFGFSIFLILFSSKFYMLSRVAYYFLLPQHIVIAQAVSRIDNKKNKFFVALIIMLFAVFYYVSLLDDATGVVPYEFFWEQGAGWL